MTKLRAIAIVLFALTASPAVASAKSEEPPRHVIKAGSRLAALTEVKLGGATLRRGSKVGVVKLVRTAGAITAVHLELADGYVVRGVPLKSLVGKFRIVK